MRNSNESLKGVFKFDLEPASEFKQVKMNFAKINASYPETLDMSWLGTLQDSNVSGIKEGKKVLQNLKMLTLPDPMTSSILMKDTSISLANSRIASLGSS